MADEEGQYAGALERAGSTNPAQLKHLRENYIREQLPARRSCVFVMFYMPTSLRAVLPRINLRYTRLVLESILWPWTRSRGSREWMDGWMDR